MCTSSRDRLQRTGRQSHIGWFPLVALVSAPIVAVCLWALQVFVITDEYYRFPSDAWAVLPPVMLIGIMVGTISSIAFIAAALLRSRRGD